MRTAHLEVFPQHPLAMDTTPCGHGRRLRRHRQACGIELVVFVRISHSCFPVPTRGRKLQPERAAEWVTALSSSGLGVPELLATPFNTHFFAKTPDMKFTIRRSAPCADGVTRRRAQSSCPSNGQPLVRPADILSASSVFAVLMGFSRGGLEPGRTRFSQC